MTTLFSIAYRSVVAGSLLFMSYVAYDIHADRTSFKRAASTADVLQQHCEYMRSVGKKGTNC